eukprot:UN04559
MTLAKYIAPFCFIYLIHSGIRCRVLLILHYFFFFLIVMILFISNTLLF